MKKILGMGNALTDILLQIEHDEVLTKLNLPKGSMQLIDSKKKSAITSVLDFSTAKMAIGGSASNTINGVNKLGVNCCFIEKIGKDEVGKFFRNDSIQIGVIPYLEYSTNDSGTCTVL